MRRASWLMACLCVCWLTFSPVLSPAAPRATRPGVAPARKVSPWSAGFLASYGRTMGHGDSFNVATGRFFVGYRFYTDPESRVSLTLRIEFLGSGYSDTQTGAEFGIIPELRLKFWTGTVSPFIGLGIGPTNNDVDTRNFAPGINFRSHIGGGVDIALVPDVALSLGVRLNHVSNGGIEQRNQGITFMEALVGLIFYFN
ncbi:MAG: acyloxyacyl hydrolase [Proteobacteria bacterium]|nr:acyloxyacyl hydrolase [Pseudomonadota bacterium]